MIETNSELKYYLTSDNVLHVTYKGDEFMFKNVFTQQDIDYILNLLN
jgi:hypothetical protein